MKPNFQAIAIGILTTLASAVGLWFASSILLMPLAESAFLWIPALVLIPSFTLGGFVAGKRTSSHSSLELVSVGATVGIISVAIFLTLTNSTGVYWVFILEIMGATILSVFGSFLSLWIGLRTS